MIKKRFTLHLTARIFYAVMIITAFMIQCTLLPLTPVKFPIFLLIPLIISVSMFEKEFSGFFFGLFAGALWDLASDITDGTLALIFSAVACVVGFLSRYLLRNTLMNAFILSIIVSVFYSFVAIISLPGAITYELTSVLMKSYYIPALIVTTISTLPSYFIVRKIAIRFRNDLN